MTQNTFVYSHMPVVYNSQIDMHGLGDFQPVSDLIRREQATTNKKHAIFNKDKAQSIMSPEVRKL
jgi:hypothetical protein